MCCPTEAAAIRGRLEKLTGVARTEIDLLQRRVTVTHSIEDRAILQSLRSLGMEAALAMPAEREVGTAETVAPPMDAEAGARRWLPLAAAGLFALASEVAALGTGQERSALVVGLALLAIALGGIGTLRKGWFALRNLTLNIHFLMSLAVIGAVLLGQWPEAAMVTVLFTLAERIEDYSLDRARSAIRTLMALTPETALVRGENDEWREADAGTIPMGQTVRVRPGERIPLDGQVTAGASTVNQAPITGESMPVEKSAGDPVFAGSINERGTFDFEVTAGRGDTTLDRIVRAVQQAQAQRAPTQRFVDRFARYYTPAVVVFALLVAVAPPLLLGQDFGPWVYRALVLLVIACPCALVLSTPIAVVSGLAAAARAGVLVKGGVYLEEGRKLRVVALDKTGTLTEGKPRVTDVIPLAGLSQEEVLHWAASLNVLSEHPVASAMVAHCATGHGDRACVLLPVTEFQSLTGRGVQGTINGTIHYVGSHRLAHENLVCDTWVEAALDRLEQEGKTAVILTDQARALAVVGVADTVRETSIEAVRQLHAVGIRTVMLTGDNAKTAAAIAATVGIDDVRGGLLPEHKLAAIGELQVQYGTVGMVGDGINDAPALARASVGFAMGAAGTATALETADVALMDDDLRKLPHFLRLSRATGRILAQNIILAIAIKAVFFALALSGTATLWMAVFADMGASLLVVFNGLRLLRFGRPS